MRAYQGFFDAQVLLDSTEHPSVRVKLIGLYESGCLHKQKGQWFI